MELVPHTFESGYSVVYKVINGTYYNSETPQELINVLEHARINRIRLKIYLGDKLTGRDWCEELDTMGYIGRSTGSHKIPLLIANAASSGGGALMDDCILKVRESKGKRVLYKHPLYKQPTLEIKPCDMEGYSHELHVNGSLYSRHTTYKSATMLKNKLA